MDERVVTRLSEGPRTFRRSIDEFHLIKLINWKKRKSTKRINQQFFRNTCYIHNILWRKFLGPRVNFQVIGPSLIFRCSSAKNRMRCADLIRWIYNFRARKNRMKRGWYQRSWSGDPPDIHRRDLQNFTPGYISPNICTVIYLRCWWIFLPENRSQRPFCPD